MPLYDYRCEKCKEVFEVFVPLKDLNVKIKCPKCQAELERQMPRVPLIQVK